MSRHNEQIVEVGGRRLKVSNLNKVMYPETGTTKAEVLKYLIAVAPVLIPLAQGRPATRKRWVEGVGTTASPGKVFFRKDLEDSAPNWLPRATVRHKDHSNIYPLVNEPAVLAWFGQMAALEIHVPQWRFGTDGKPSNPDRMVLDLDPGDGAALPECAETARLCRELLMDMDLSSFPVTSGSKGIHVYVPLDGSHTSAQISELANELARSLEADHPDLVVSDMKKSLRTGKVLVDWSQNSDAKTTICPYSLRGKATPTVATPRTWEEISDPHLRHLEFNEVLARLGNGIDPMATFDQAQVVEGDRLQKYRSMRDAGKTPEPVPAEPAAHHETQTPRFVIQEHHASRLHWDFRLEHSGVLVSWAVPKGPPLDSGENRLAVMTEDHPLDYGSFSGTIPKGQYGAGTVKIWDSGTYTLEKWREGKEIIAVLHGKSNGGLGGFPRRYALINTPGLGDHQNWLIHLMKDQPKSGHGPNKDKAPGSSTIPRTGLQAQNRDQAKKQLWAGVGAPLPAPMLAGTGESEVLFPEDDWSFEMKWDGMRTIAGVSEGTVTLMSRNGHNITAQYPELQELAALVPDGSVLDGEIVALNTVGRPDFGLLQTRMKLISKREIGEGVKRTPVQLMLFDALQLTQTRTSGPEPLPQSLIHKTYTTRRAALFSVFRDGKYVHLPPVHPGNLQEAAETSQKLGLEGVMAKRNDGRYSSGKRSRGWVKVKTERHQEVIIIGWRKGEGSRKNTFGSLLLAVSDGEHLHYAGRVGTGFTARTLEGIATKLKKIERKTPPISDLPPQDRRNTVWVTPKFVAEVRYTEITKDGKLRHPTWRGWRPDKSAQDVRWEN